MFDALKAEIARLEAELGAKWETVWAEIDRLEAQFTSAEPPSVPESPPTEPPADGPVPGTPYPAGGMANPTPTPSTSEPGVA